MGKKDLQRRIDERVEGAAQAVGAVVTSSQVITGKPNIIGGWVFGPVSLSNSGVVLHSGGWIQVGSDDHTVRLDAVDTAYRMWAGAPIGADAPFSITVDGSLHAENAYIEGEIVATTGLIGGFEIGADYIRDVADSMGLASTVTGGDDVRFWAGDTYANRATADFRVTEAGALVATNATITGAITANSGSLGTLNVTGTLTLTTGDIESDNFATGVLGWQITHDGVAEFQDAFVRGVLSAVVFEEEVVSVVEGTLRIGKAATTCLTTSEITLPAAMGYLLITHDVANGEDVVLSDFITLRYGGQQDTVQADGAYDSTDGFYGCNNTGGTPGHVYPVGSEILFSPISDAPGYLLLTADVAMNGPRYVVMATGDVIAGVFGNLDGSYGIATESYGIGVGDYDSGNGDYLRWDAANGLVIHGPAVTASLGAISLPDDGWIGYPSGPLITFDNSDEQVEVTATTLWVGGNVGYSGDLKPYRNATSYTAYAFVPLATKLTSTSWDGDEYYDGNDEAVIDLSAVFGVPAGVKAVLVTVAVYCAAGAKEFRVGPSTSNRDVLVVFSPTGGGFNSGSSPIQCDANGDIFFVCTALTAEKMQVWLRINGYWI